jgi:hypothetical protein
VKQACGRALSIEFAMYWLKHIKQDSSDTGAGMKIHKKLMFPKYEKLSDVLLNIGHLRT